jgi:hypothetical protein
MHIRKSTPILKNKLHRARTECFVWLVIITGFAVSSVAQTNGPAALDVIPEPQEVKAAGEPFDPATAKMINVSDFPEDRLAARLLQESLRGTHGVDGNIVTQPAGKKNLHRLWLGIGEANPVSPALPTGAAAEGYVLSVHANGVEITASTDAGLFYGVQTLIQLLEQARREKAAIPGMEMIDWPSFDWRGRYFDGSQYLGTIVDTRASLEREIKLMSRYKLNWLCIEVYNLVPFKSFPACANANSLSLADWDYLVELAHNYHVTLVPSLQSFAQMYQVIWECDAGKPYREETAPGLICPSRPENIVFLQGLYRDLISVFKYSPVIGIGCSEVGMQWQKKYCPLCQKRIDNGETLSDIFCKHVRDCVHAVDAAAKEAGRSVRPMMWGDEFYMGYDGKRWTGIDMIPKNTVMGHWKYWKGYEGISGLVERGFDVFFLSATYQHNVYLVDLSPEDPSGAEGKWADLMTSGIRNVADQAQQAMIDKQKNLPGKILGGGCATFSQHDLRCWDTTWFAYALQSEYSWGDARQPLNEKLNRFTEKFAATFYGARDVEAAKTIASAYHELDAVKSDIERNNYLIRDIVGIYDVQDLCYADNNLEASLKLIDALAAKPAVPGKSVADIRRRCEHVLEVARPFRQKLAAMVSRVDNTESLQYLISAPHKIENHAQCTLLLLDLAEAFRKWDTAKDADTRASLLKEFSALQRRLDVLQRDTRVLADEMDELAYVNPPAVLRQGTSAAELAAAAASDTTGYHKALASLDAFKQRIAKILQTDLQAKKSSL